MNKRLSYAAIVIIVLCAVGLVRQLLINPLVLLIPAAVFGIVFFSVQVSSRAVARTVFAQKRRLQIQGRSRKAKAAQETARRFSCYSGQKGRSAGGEAQISLTRDFPFT